MKKLEKRVSAVLVAAGSSTRMGFDKLSFDLGGETVLHRSIRAFEQNPLVTEIVLVAGKNRAFVEQQAADCTKPVQIVTGGTTRAESAKNGVLAAAGELVAVHDAARPFVSQAVITAALEAAARCGAAAPAVPVKDTIKAAARGNGKTVPDACLVYTTPDRSTLYAVQTPQCFDRAEYLAALEELDAEKARLVTDDCSLFELTGRAVQLTQGDYANYKITTREDLPRPEQKEEHKMRIGHGYDVHRLVEGRKLILGGVEVPFEKGLLGHSDADVLAHAVMDAVLGAAALAEGITRHRNLKLGCWAFVLMLSMSVRCSPLTTLAMPGFVIEHFPIQIPATQYFISLDKLIYDRKDIGQMQAIADWIDTHCAEGEISYMIPHDMLYCPDHFKNCQLPATPINDKLAFGFSVPGTHNFPMQFFEAKYVLTADPFPQTFVGNGEMSHKLNERFLAVRDEYFAQEATFDMGNGTTFTIWRRTVAPTRAEVEYYLSAFKKEDAQYPEMFSQIAESWLAARGL